jgi:hypothetical protein
VKRTTAAEPILLEGIRVDAMLETLCLVTFDALKDRRPSKQAGMALVYEGQPTRAPEAKQVRAEPQRKGNT